MTQQAPLPALLPSRDAYLERLRKILPREITGTTSTDNPAAAACAYVMMYCGAIEGQNPVRPMTITHMRNGIAARQDDASRLAYYDAARRSGEAIVKLCVQWGLTPENRWYASDSREGPRDETFKNWADNNALIVDPSVKASSSVGRYTLTREFAALLHPSLTGDDLEEAIFQWQQNNLTPTGRARAAHRASLARQAHTVTVHLPGGGIRNLLPGPSSIILKGLVESSSTLLAEPSVVFISQSGEPVNIVDNQQLQRLGLDLDKLPRLLPDALLIDIAKSNLWFVEIVATDGPVDDHRKAVLSQWAIDSGQPVEDCRFLTAFMSRTAPEARKCLQRLARGSFAWFLDEPDALLSWSDISQMPPTW